MSIYKAPHCPIRLHPTATSHRAVQRGLKGQGDWELPLGAATVRKLKNHKISDNQSLFQIFEVWHILDFLYYFLFLLIF